MSITLCLWTEVEEETVLTSNIELMINKKINIASMVNHVSGLNNNHPKSKLNIIKEGRRHPV